MSRVELNIPGLKDALVFDTDDIDTVCLANGIIDIPVNDATSNWVVREFDGTHGMRLVFKNGKGPRWENK